MHDGIKGRSRDKFVGERTQEDLYVLPSECQDFVVCQAHICVEGRQVDVGP